MRVASLMLMILAMRATPGSSNPLTPDQAASVVVCLLDIDQAFVYLGLAGVAIEAVHVDCAKGAAIADCSAAISAIIGGFSWGAVYLLALATSCSTKNIKPTQRLGAMTEIVASLADIAFGASSITQDCHGDYSRVAYAANRQAEATACAFDGDLAGTFVARAGLQLRAATLDCPNKGAKRLCAVNVGAVAASIAWVAQFISLTATDCPTYINAGSACAADIAAIVAAGLQLGVSSTALSVLLPPTPNFAPIIPFGRRLQDDAWAGPNLASSVAGEQRHGRGLYADGNGDSVRGPLRLRDLFMSWANLSDNETVPKVTPSLVSSLMRHSDWRPSVARQLSRNDLVLV